MPWRDYGAHLLLLVATVILGALRIAGAVQRGRGWLVLIPLWLLMAIYAASFAAAVIHRDR